MRLLFLCSATESNGAARWGASTIDRSMPRRDFTFVHIRRGYVSFSGQLVEEVHNRGFGWGGERAASDSLGFLQELFRFRHGFRFALK